MHIRANILHLIGRLNQTTADGVLSLSAFKPSSSDSADRGRSIIRVNVRVGGLIKFEKQINDRIISPRGKDEIYKIRLTLPPFIVVHVSRRDILASSICLYSNLDSEIVTRTT